MNNYLLRTARAVAVAKAPIANEANLEAVRKALSGAAPDSEEYKRYTKAMRNREREIVNALQGNPLSDPALEKMVDSEIQKHLNAIMPQEYVAATYMSMMDEVRVDSGYSAAFEVTTAPAGVGNVLIESYDEDAVWDEYPEGAQIQVKGKSERESVTVREKRFGAARSVSLIHLERGDPNALNRARTSLDMAWLAKMSNLGYAAIANATAGATTNASGATVDDIVNALNAGVQALMLRMTDNGYNLSIANTPLLFYAHWSHKSLVDQALRRAQFTQDRDVPLLNNSNIIPVYTLNSNFPTQFSSKNAGRLVLPGFENKWCIFTGGRTTQENNLAAESVTIYASNRLGYNVNGDQVQVVNLQA